MIFESASDVVVDDVFVRLPGFVRDVSVLLKLEGLNPAASVKLKSALSMVESAEAEAEAEAEGTLTPGSRLIESSSGNLGIALSTVCAARGYQLTVVTDPNAARQAIRAMESLGTDVVEVSRRDPSGGYLGTRLDCIRRRIAADPQLIWLNQYANRADVRAHKERTAKAIHRELGDIDALHPGTRLHIEEIDAIAPCRMLAARYGLLVGGSKYL